MGGNVFGFRSYFLLYCQIKLGCVVVARCDPVDHAETVHHDYYARVVYTPSHPTFIYISKTGVYRGLQFYLYLL